MAGCAGHDLMPRYFEQSAGGAGSRALTVARLMPLDRRPQMDCGKIFPVRAVGSTRETLNPHRDLCSFRRDFREPGPTQSEPLRFQPSPNVDSDRGTRKAAHARLLRS
jgi:hypothetical protein